MPARMLNVACAATVVGALLTAAPAVADGDESYRAGVGLLDRGMHAEAAAELRAALESAPAGLRRDEIRYALAIALVRMKKDADAAGTLKEIPLDARFEHAPDALLLRGRLAFDAGDHASAASVLAALEAHHGSFPRLADAAWLRGEALLRAGKAPEAQAVLDAAIERWPEHAGRPRSTVLCAAAEVSLGDDAAAAARLGKLRNEPLEPALLAAAALMEAQALHRLERWEATLDAAEAALRSEVGTGSGSGADAAPSYAGSAPAAILARSALLRLGDAALADGDPAAAERWLTRLRDGLVAPAADAPAGAPAGPRSGTSSQERAAALLRLAIAIDRQGRAAEALPLYTSVVELGGPEALHARFASAAALLALERVDEARAMLTALVDATEAPIELRVEALRRLGELARDRGDTAELVLVESRMLALDGAAPELRLRATVEVARLRLESKDATGALAALKTMESIRLAGRPEEGSADPSGRRGPTSPVAADPEPDPDPLVLRAIYLRGVALATLDRDAEAAEALTPLESLERAALADESTLHMVDAGQLLLGETRLRSGDAPGAAAALQRLVAGDGLARLPATTASTALLRLGEACTAAQRWSGAEEAFLRHRTRFPDDPLWFQAGFGAGLAQERQGRHDAAIESYRSVVDRHDGVTAARARFHIGECLYALGRFDDAVREFLKVDLLHANSEWSAAALYEAGRCLVEQERFADARAQFDRVIANDAAREWGTLARERLVEVDRALRPEPLPGAG